MKAYITPETSPWKIVIATLCGVLIAWAGLIVYDHLTVRYLARLQAVEHEVALLRAESRPLVTAKDSTVNYFLNGERQEEGD